MAGSGDLSVLRLCRVLRSRIGSPVTYGSHMAVGMACGLLFLGGGKSVFTFSACHIYMYSVYTCSNKKCIFHLHYVKRIMLACCLWTDTVLDETRKEITQI